MSNEIDLTDKELLYWFNKYWVFPDTSHDHWEPSTRAYRQIVALLKKPQVTEEWIEEKASIVWREMGHWQSPEEAKDFIHTLVKEIAGNE